MIESSKRPVDLESLRALLGESDITLAVGLVKQVEVLEDKSKSRALVSVFPDEFEVVADQTADAAGPGSGIHQIPVANDLVLLGFVSPDEAYILRKLTNIEDKLPNQAADGHLVMKALAGKKAYLSSDVGVMVGSGGDADPTEPLVLGAVLMTMLGELITKFDVALDKIISGPVGTGNNGFAVPTFPALATDLGTIKTDLATIKETYLDTTASNIVSGKHKTER